MNAVKLSTKDIAKIDPIDLESYVENDDYLRQL